MDDIDSNACPMPEPFRAKVGIPLFLAWIFFLGFVTRVMFAPLMPAIEHDLGIDHAQAGSLFLMISLGYLIAPLCSGLISSKINHKGTVMVSIWVIGLALIPFTVVKSLIAIRILLMVIGLAAGIQLPSAIATITGEIRREDWGKALSIHQSAPPLSFVSAPLIAAGLMRLVSWRLVLACLAVAVFVSAAAYSLRGRGGRFPGKPASLANVKAVLAKPSFWILVVLFAMAMGGNAGIYAMLPLYLVSERGMALGWANTVVGLSQISGLVMVFAAGWIADRIGQKPTMAVALATAGVATILLGILKGGGLMVAIFLQPALLALFFPGAFAALSRVAPPRFRSVTNALGPPMSFLIGGGLLPTLIGYLGETRSFATGIVLAGTFMLGGPILVLFLKLGQFDDQPGC